MIAPPYHDYRQVSSETEDSPRPHTVPHPTMHQLQQKPQLEMQQAQFQYYQPMFMPMNSQYLMAPMQPMELRQMSDDQLENQQQLMDQDNFQPLQPLVNNFASILFDIFWEYFCSNAIFLTASEKSKNLPVSCTERM